MADRAELLDAFEARNLLGRWPGAAGKGSAWDAARARRAASRKPLRGVVVLLGARVARAYDLDPLGWGHWLRLTRHAAVVAVPHPSGVNHLYNDPAARELAGRVLREALSLADSGAILPAVPDARRAA
jgi:hypothetical protein